MIPDISFVIPAYNAQAYLAHAISSCLGQSHKNIQVVVVDDASTDATPKIIKHFVDGDPRCISVRSHKNFGRGFSRNVGCIRADAKYIAVLDADDMCDKGRAKETLRMFDKHGDCLVYGHCAVINCVSNQYGIMKFNEFDYEKCRETGDTNIVHSTLAYPKSVWMKVRYDEGEYQAAGLDDWKFELDCVRSGFKIVSTEEVLSAYRHNIDGISANRDAKTVESLKRRYWESHEIIPA